MVYASSTAWVMWIQMWNVSMTVEGISEAK